MSKVLLYADNHWAQYSSILRRRGEEFSVRLENQINSINWLESLATECGCDSIICLGDFFDRDNLNSEELSALNAIKWNRDANHYFLVGNHEMGVHNLTYNSAKVFNMINHCETIDKPQFLPQSNILFIPYDLDSTNKQLKDYFTDGQVPNNLIVLSHNDIKGVQYGKFVSQSGFDLTDIETNCAMFINGHLHNGTFLNTKKTILNLGNLTGQNFSEDASKYAHNVCVLDTDTMEYYFYENPYAFNFYKLDLTNKSMKAIQKLIKGLKTNSVISAKVDETLLYELREFLSTCDHIVDSRIIIQPTAVDTSASNSLGFVKLDHIQQFYDYILNDLGSNPIILEELEALNAN